MALYIPHKKCHNHYWPVKVILVIGLIIASFFVKFDGAERPVMFIGLGGACVFIIIQLACLIDFSSNWALSWERAADRDGHYGWLCLIGFTSTTLSMMFFTACYLMFKGSFKTIRKTSKKSKSSWNVLMG